MMRAQINIQKLGPKSIMLNEDPLSEKNRLTCFLLITINISES